ncbi:GGDEF domain-containing protein [Tabrizicola soli]|uniref:Diguanylate cyclase domain-containing protein n=1 Tax=Tabrizicola soli TaxID=2185115 RepID=A0ABV7DVM7_9RHOB
MERDPDRPVPEQAMLARFMPMHLLLDREGRVLGAGPTLRRMLQRPDLAGARFEDLFEVRAPGGAVTADQVLARAGHRFRLVARNGVRAGLRGMGERLPDGRMLMNLSFGIDLIAAVRELGLTDADFVATDLAMELLYLAEANAAVTRELRGLNLRLEGARLAAEEEALTDPLTGLRNRRAADLVLARLCAARMPFGLLHLDLDYFKSVNDTLGHAAGDHVLEVVGRILRAELRVEDCAARIGGDEFLVLVVKRVDLQVLRGIADRIIQRISAPIPVAGKVAQVSASIGIVRSSDLAAPDPVRLMALADRALYAAKRAGRGRSIRLRSAAD